MKPEVLRVQTELARSVALGHVHITPFSFKSIFVTKNGAIFPPCSNYFVFKQKRISFEWCSHLFSHFVFALCSLFSLLPDYVSVFVCYQLF